MRIAPLFAPTKRLALLSFFLALPAPSEAPPVRIACIGDETIFGGSSSTEAGDVETSLSTLLSSHYLLRSFTEAGASLLTFSLSQPYREAQKFSPEILLVSLGAKDAPEGNPAPDFEQEYARLLGSFAGARAILVLPPPDFRADSSGRLTRERLTRAIQSVAYTTGAEVVDLQTPFLDRLDLFPDSAHPSHEGRSKIAARLAEAIALPGIPDFDLISRLKTPANRSNYYGYNCYDFSFETRDARVVCPKRAARGLPWIWRARFWGHEPQTEIALLERGFHVAYCDVAELYGNPEAIGHWNRFYDTLVSCGLSRKVVLEGFSRGGMYLYRWAVANPGRVACVYADAPVLDMKSWPGAKGKGAGNPVEWERFKEDFHLASEAEALAFSGNPLDHAAEIARGDFPMLHICGTADKIVPIEENTDLFEKRILKAGGKITVIRKLGVGHHPHSLPNPERIVDFILRATGVARP